MSSTYDIQARIDFCKKVRAAIGDRRVALLLTHPDDAEQFGRFANDCPAGAHTPHDWHLFRNAKADTSGSVPRRRVMIVPGEAFTAWPQQAALAQFGATTGPADAWVRLSEAVFIDLPDAASGPLSVEVPCDGRKRITCHCIAVARQAGTILNADDISNLGAELPRSLTSLRGYADTSYLCTGCSICEPPTEEGS